MYQLVSDQNQIRVCKGGVIKYCSNLIQTSKYTWYNFLPKNLFEQFTKMANIYFLILAILQSIQTISLSDGQPTILFPLSFILAVTMAKDLYEDTKRKKSDKQENENICNLINSLGKWQDLYVGNIIKIMDNEQIPCDVLILKTPNKKGECYIETKNLDGETNLKIKKAPQQLQQLNEFNHIYLEYDQPNNLLYKFQGTCYVESNDDCYQLLEQKEKLIDQVTQSRPQHIQDLLAKCRMIDEKMSVLQQNKFPLDNNNIILRGSNLKNTEYIVGLAIYTGNLMHILGHDTKIMKNSVKPKYKKSKLEIALGQRILIIFIIQLILCIFSGFFYSGWYNIHKDELPYLYINRRNNKENSFAYNLFVRFGNWILMLGYLIIQFRNLVPISLLVTLETVKFCQAFLIQFDDQLKFNDEKCSVQSSNLNDELGQIKYILSDKTGTLTKNQMVFKQICIEGISYGEDSRNVQTIDYVQFNDNNFQQNLENADSIFLSAMYCLVLCHSAIVEKKDTSIQYNVTSPDELALLNFAKQFNILYQGIDENNIITINFRGVIKNYQFMYSFEFTPERKRSSVIVEDIADKKIFMYTKGADSVMMAKQNKGDEEKFLQKYQKYIDDYSSVGLRVLLLGMKEIHWSEFAQWESEYKKAQTEMNDRDQKVEMLQDQLENDIKLVGLTGVEDKLQDNVDETIYFLREAGISVWVLTGDKIETAINIAHSCKLLDQKMKITIIGVPQNIEQQLVQSDALVISGECLTYIFDNDQLTLSLTRIVENCKSILCCRVSPLQKQQVVAFVRKHFPDKSTLAIGDGANDVSMITSAHVGIGIKGVEGQQASRAADYAIGEFQLLRKLLFVHGRECYRRNSDLVLYNFYKNIILVLPQFWFSVYNQFSGQRIFDSLIFQAYNVFYTSMPIITYAVFDEEYSSKTLFENKYQTYRIGHKNKCFNPTLFWLMFLIALCQSAIIAFFTIYSIENDINSQGKEFGLWYTGMIVYWLAILISNLRIVTITNTWSPAHIFFLLGMIAMFFFTLLIFQTFPSYDAVFNIFQLVFKSSQFYLNCILVAGATSLFDYATIKYQQYKQKHCPNNRIYSIEQNTQKPQTLQ